MSMDRFLRVSGLAMGMVAAAILSQLGMPRLYAEELARGKQLYKLCTACHGDRGEGNRQLSAPALAGLPSWYAADELRNFRDGVRGYHPSDVAGLQMRAMALALTTEDDLKAVAAYTAGLKPVPPAATIDGDPVRGKVLYTPCTACHGADGKGNEALKSPSLLFHNDWYTVEQLKKFRAGLRGAHKKDVRGAQMRAMVATLPDEQALSDVAAYVQTLGR